MTKLLAFAQAYASNKDGATAIEYGLIAAGISLAIAAVVFLMGDDLLTVFEGIQGDLATAAAR